MSSTLVGLIVLAMVVCIVAAVIYAVVWLASTAWHNAYGWGTKHGDNKPSEKGCDKASSLKEYAKLTDDMKCKADDIDKEKILDLNGVNEKERKCIEKRADLGNELYSQEIMHCYKRNN